MDNPKDFNLIDEPWIRVLTSENKIIEVSISEVFNNAHKYKELKGDVATQDVPILRLLIAILYSVFSKVNSKGEKISIETEEDALDIWEDLWIANEFPKEPIRKYLEKWHDRFWLFHPEKPFWQVNEAHIGTQYGANKLNGAISESNNKIRLFSSSSGEAKNTLSYAAAARWLLHVNAFDDTSGKKSATYREMEKINGKQEGSPGTGWLGKLGLIFAVGSNIFETLMLNLTMLKNGTDLWEAGMPIWEEEKIRSNERNPIEIPQNIAQLYTLQSRRLFLKRNNLGINEYFLLAGDFFNRENALSEQMTVWRPIKGGKGKTEIIGWQPKKHDPSKQFWRDFSDIFVTEPEKTQPGIVAWISRLNRNKLLNRKQKLHFKTASVQYGDKDFFIIDLFQDSISFSTNIISDIGTRWQKYIENEILKCDELAKELATFAVRLEKASGNTLEEKNLRNSGLAKEIKDVFYHRLDLPFKKWISEINPNCLTNEEQSKRLEWRSIAKQITLKLGDDMYSKSGSNAFVGRIITDSKKVSRRYTSPEAYKWFKVGINKIYSN